MAVLGVEIGGTKLQLAIGDGRSASLSSLIRRRVDRPEGASGILAAIDEAIAELDLSQIESIGVGFGGPVDGSAGRVRLSHQVEGWNEFPLGDWFQERIRAPLLLLNDCDAAALGEARWGAGGDYDSMFYVTVGTGIGGGHVVGGQLQGQGRPSVAEIGHLRVAQDSTPDDIVESYASGLGIAARARQRLEQTDEPSKLRQLDASVQLQCEDVARAAEDGDRLANAILIEAAQTLGWAIGQVVTLLAPEIVVVGGGVSEISSALFLERVERAAREQSFPPLRDSFHLARAKLGEEVVLHGAISAAATLR